MTDRELLKFAAKAANISYDKITDAGCIKRTAEYGDDSFSFKCWNPLQDDGDALRLAVKLGISVLLFPACIGTRWPQNRMTNALIGFDPPIEDISSGQDCHAATRRAIVRAAAEIERTNAAITKKGGAA